MTKINIDRAVVEQARAALAHAVSHLDHQSAIYDCDEAIAALRAALAQEQAEPVQEPVAWIDPKHLEWLAQSPDNLTGAGLAARQRSADMKPLYTAPQQAEPVQEPVPQKQAEPTGKESLTVERLRDALVASRIVDPAAVEDPDGYDNGLMLYRIEALHRRLT